MSRLVLRTGAVVALVSSVFISEASAHCFVGGRFLPATLDVDDPCVADEFALPTVSTFKNGEDPSTRQIEVSGEYSKRITGTVGISLGSTWTHLRASGGRSASGFQNLETSFRWQFLTAATHEFVMSAAVEIEWGRTGAAKVGAEGFSVATPTLFFGKGFGDLPDTVRWLRPFAVTGLVGYAIPTRRSTTTLEVDPATGDRDLDVERHPRVLVSGGAIQYSMPYLKSSVVDLGLPDVVNRLIPIVEGRFETPVSNTATSGTVTTGTVNPGVIWVGEKFQVGVEAIVPLNRESGTSVGVMAQLHLYLDDLFPATLGKPLFGGTASPRTSKVGS